MAAVPHPTSLDLATDYLRRRMQPIPVPWCKKGPRIHEWQKIRTTDESALRRYFNDGQQANIGLLLGVHDLADVDLDCCEAEQVAARILPATECIFGRTAKPRSHYLYRAADATAHAYTDPRNSQTLVELRGKGQQTIVPGSMHPSGELVRFAVDGEPATVDAGELSAAVARLAAAALLVRSGWTADDAVLAVTTEPARLVLVPKDVAASVRQWLGLEGEQPKPKPPTSRASADDGAELVEAVGRFNVDHSGDWPKSGGDCPMCGHRDCFGTMPGDPQRWACFSTGHAGPGVRGDRCYHGDSLDLAAHAAGCSRVELLRRAGYFGTRREPAGPGNRIGRTSVRFTADILHEVVPQAIAVLAAAGGIFQRAQTLVEVVAADGGQERDGIARETGSPVIVSVTPARLAELLSGSITWLKHHGGGRGWEPCGPPRDVVAAIHGRKTWSGIPELRGVITTPVLRRDGSLITVPGFDRATGLLYKPTGEPPTVPAAPTRDDALLALALLHEAVEDFPFAKPEHRATWIAALLTPPAIGAVDNVPLFIGDANTPGSGKSLLFDVVALVVTGGHMARSPWAAKDEEMRKRITSHALAGDSLVLIDNVPGGAAVGWASLDSAITGGVWCDRMLGRSEIVRLPFKAVWFVTGNNLAVQSDAGRRVLRIRLEAQQERPEERTGFRHDPLLVWVRENRSRLLGAVLTILRAYVTAGRPVQPLMPFGSFETWSALVRNAVVWLGEPDPVLTSAARDPDMDLDRLAHTRALAAWFELDASGRGLSVSAVLKRIKPAMDGTPDDAVLVPMHELADALRDLCHTRANGELPTAREVGYRLRALKGRPRTVQVGGRDLELAFRATTDRNGVAVWRAAVLSRAGHAGDCGVPGDSRPTDFTQTDIFRARSCTNTPQSPSCPARQMEPDEVVL